MNIDCYLSKTCGSEDALMEAILEALALEGAEAEALVHRIDEDEAGRLGLRGSPSVLINGRDIEPAPPEFTGFG